MSESAAGMLPRRIWPWISVIHTRAAISSTGARAAVDDGLRVRTSTIVNLAELLVRQPAFHLVRHAVNVGGLCRCRRCWSEWGRATWSRRLLCQGHLGVAVRVDRPAELDGGSVGDIDAVVECALCHDGVVSLVELSVWVYRHPRGRRRGDVDVDWGRLGCGREVRRRWRPGLRECAGCGEVEVVGQIVEHELSLSVNQPTGPVVSTGRRAIGGAEVELGNTRWPRPTSHPTVHSSDSQAGTGPCRGSSDQLCPARARTGRWMSATAERALTTSVAWGSSLAPDGPSVAFAVLVGFLGDG